MDVKYDSEKINKDCMDFLDSFKLKMQNLAEEILGNVYADCLPHIETDAMLNYREHLRLELECDYMRSKFKNEWAKNFRRAIFVENREEMSKLISEDILKRIKELEDRTQEYEVFRYSPGGDCYRDLLEKNRKLSLLLTKLIDDIETPSRLGLADPVNDKWGTLNEAKLFLKEIHNQIGRS